MATPDRLQRPNRMGRILRQITALAFTLLLTLSASAADPPRCVQRDHAAQIPDQWKFLQKHITLNPSDDAPLTARQAHEDLDQLEWHLENEFSYLRRKNVDYRAALDAIRASITGNIDRRTFAIQLMKLLALFGDGHSRISNTSELLPAGYAPFSVHPVDGKLVAINPETRAFLGVGYPFLKRLDNIDIDKWLDAAKRLSPAGSEEMILHHAARNLSYLQYLRQELNLPLTPSIRIELHSPDNRTKILTLPLADKPASFDASPQGGHRLLPGNVGYIRIRTMSSGEHILADLTATMHRFRNTRALIIDVRGNEGGSRDALLHLFPSFMKPTDLPRIVNIAAIRLSPNLSAANPDGFLLDRSLFPVTARQLSPQAKLAIEQFAPTFKTEWPLPANEFSAWHYLVLEPQKDRVFYRDRVAILMDSDCFSPTEIFLAAFKGWRNITLIGLPSSDGSGRPQPLQLFHSELKLQLSSIASFQPSGLLFESRGVQPDIVIAPKATDLTGATDTILDAALKHLR
jgi:hypothetical protein